MNPKFIQTSREQQLLFPPSIQDWLPEEHLARFVVDIVSQLNLQPLAETYSGKGLKAYHSVILLSLLFYGYATGVFSSRKTEQATYDSVASRFLSADAHPDHDTPRRRKSTRRKSLPVRQNPRTTAKNLVAVARNHQLRGHKKKIRLI